MDVGSWEVSVIKVNFWNDKFVPSDETLVHCADVERQNHSGPNRDECYSTITSSIFWCFNYIATSLASEKLLPSGALTSTMTADINSSISGMFPTCERFAGLLCFMLSSFSANLQLVLYVESPKC